MSWIWRLTGGDGQEVSDVASPGHPSQSDAESWLGEQWRDLAAAGVAQVTLLDGEAEVYGPMPLSES